MDSFSLFKTNLENWERPSKCELCTYDDLQINQVLHTLELNKDIFEYEVQKNHIMLFFPKIVINATSGHTEVIRELFFRVPFIFANITQLRANKTAYTFTQHTKQYVHSHITGSGWTNEICQGVTKLVIRREANLIERWILLIQYLKDFIVHESSDTNPYNSIGDFNYNLDNELNRLDEFPIRFSFKDYNYNYIKKNGILTLGLNDNQFESDMVKFYPEYCGFHTADGRFQIALEPSAKEDAIIEKHDTPEGRIYFKDRVYVTRIIPEETGEKTINKLLLKYLKEYAEFKATQDFASYTKDSLQRN